jgi:predicted Zn finger-like uncharacterized protein
MKFACDKCNTRYSIADERVHGRVLKIRCKACNHVITVREELPSRPAPAATGASMADALSQFAGDDDLQTRVSTGLPPSLAAEMAEDWYISFDGEQEGPLPLARALDRVRTERPRGKECYCWRGGFFVWLPVDEVPEFQSALAKPLPPAPRTLQRPSGQHAGGKPHGAGHGAGPGAGHAAGSTGSPAALRSAAGREAAAREAAAREAAAVKAPSPHHPTLKATAGQLPATKPSTTGTHKALGRERAGAPAPASLPSTSFLDSAPEALLPALPTKPEPRVARKLDEAAPLPPLDSSPKLSPFAAALQASGPTLVAGQQPKIELPLPNAAPIPDTGPVPLPPPPEVGELPIGEASGLLNLSHISKPALAAPTTEAGKPVLDTFGGIPVTPPIPTPASQPIVAMPGRALGAPRWMKWAALAGALATVGLGIAVVVLIVSRKPTVIVVPPAPKLDDGKKADDKPITVTDDVPGSAAAADAAKRGQKRPPSSARAAAGVKPSEKDNLTGAQRNLASLYRDASGEHGAKSGVPTEAAVRGGGNQVSQQAIMAVVTQNRRSLNLCYDRVLKHDQSLKSGRVVTHVKIGISGIVTGVSVPDPQYANSEIGQCIAQTIRHWHFPSADTEYETEFPIILQAN